MTEKPFLSVLSGKPQKVPPIWLMRQAGRYLPEYRDVRKGYRNFLDMVYDPGAACEVTLQPLRRYRFDAAILFSDILVVPDALGCQVDFVEGEGPKIAPFRFSDLALEGMNERLTPVFETVAEIREKMRLEGFSETALIGFCGAPWTLACYMIEGKGSRDFLKTRKEAFENPEGFQNLIDLLVEASISYLTGQIKAGVEAIQIFESHAGILSAQAYRKWVIAPIQKIVEGVKLQYPEIPVIGFPKGSGFLYEDFARDSGVDALGLDCQVDPLEASSLFSLPLQGNLDPAALLAGGEAMIRETEAILQAFSGKPFIFNLGHGVDKETSPETVALLVETIRKGENL